VKREFPRWVVEADLAHEKEEIFPLERGGRRYWFKRGRATGSTAIHDLGYRLTGLPFLRPVERKSAPEAAAWEAEKLRRLGEEGLPVPEVIAEGEGFFVMSDRGEGLAGKLKRAGREEGDRWLAGVVDALAALHRAGEYHGASQIRNFVLNDAGEVGIIDFEESFDAGSELRALQFRDLFLLLYSLHRQKHATDYPALLERYMERSGNREFAGELHGLYRRFRWLAKLMEPEGVRRRLGSDAEILHRLFESLKG
jgi:tRNA A-37 threonylcarbamoyl transferase component Bud32